MAHFSIKFYKPKPFSSDFAPLISTRPLLTGRAIPFERFEILDKLGSVLSSDNPILSIHFREWLNTFHLEENSNRMTEFCASESIAAAQTVNVIASLRILGTLFLPDLSRRGQGSRITARLTYILAGDAVKSAVEQHISTLTHFRLLSFLFGL